MSENTETTTVKLAELATSYEEMADQKAVEADKVVADENYQKFLLALGLRMPPSQQSYDLVSKIKAQRSTK